MPTPATQSKSKNAEIELSGEERLKLAWEKYSGMAYFFLGLVALGVLAKGGWQYLNVQKELGIQKEFSDCTTPDAFLTFAAKHPGHPLAGVAEETVADQSFAAGKYLEALKAYSSAAADLPEGPVRAHARLGVAMALELSGKTGEAETNLRHIMDDSTELKTIRCEAGYHLAGIAVASGRGAEVQKLAEELMKIDPSSPFSERTFMLRPTAPVAAAPAALTVPTIALPTKP
jgi:hypothetical protein